ncbi:Leucine-rich repeat receptor protein kinase EMS1 [Linum perenne]
MAKALNFLSLAVFFFTVCSSNPELETLLSFKSSLQNPKSLSSWNESLPFCNWVGITCRLGRVSSLELTSASLSGEIPPQLGELTHLRTLKLGLNSLTGNLPPEIGNLTSLVTLDLSGNGLEGKLPVEIGKLTRLKFLDLNSNFFSGQIPGEIFNNFRELTSVDISNNSLSGSLPAEIGNAVVLETLVLNDNRISGSIPKEIGNLSALSLLNLNSNHLEGSIPVEIGKCGSLTMLDLGNNSLTCSIPDELANLSELQSLVLSHNGLSGSIPGKPSSYFRQPLLKVTLSNILEGTNNFCNSNIIGDGGFGTVYKAKLVTKNNNDILVVAVKKLSHSKAQGDREFMAEMETLGKVKHKNLVSLLGYCSLGEEKLLVYEYMANGSLDTWLRDGLNPKPLDWATRLKIAIGSARGLAFLHHGFTPHVIHRDVKSSNILLDPDFEAKVADFGLARLISAYETHVSTEIAGTLGYIPPEYGQSGRASVKGDVYSYGVILLELVTGKEPTGPEFKEGEGGNLVGWVLQKVKKGEGVDVVDQSVVNGGGRLGVMMMMKVLEVAVGCLAEKPNDRPSMRQVLEGLKGIRGW